MDRGNIITGFGPIWIPNLLCGVIWSDQGHSMDIIHFDILTECAWKDYIEHIWTGFSIQNNIDVIISKMAIWSPNFPGKTMCVKRLESRPPYSVRCHLRFPKVSGPMDKRKSSEVTPQCRSGTLIPIFGI